MCECGCTMNNEAYRLPGGKDWFYVIELYAGCKNCSAGPGILVRKLDARSFDYDDYKDYQLLPLKTYDNAAECPIRCGLDRDEFRAAAKDSIVGYPTDRRAKLDADDAYEIAGEVWEEAVHRRPMVGER